MNCSYVKGLYVSRRYTDVTKKKAVLRTRARAMSDERPTRSTIPPGAHGRVGAAIKSSAGARPGCTASAAIASRRAPDASPRRARCFPAAPNVAVFRIDRERAPIDRFGTIPLTRLLVRGPTSAISSTSSGRIRGSAPAPAVVNRDVIAIDRRLRGPRALAKRANDAEEDKQQTLANQRDASVPARSPQSTQSPQRKTRSLRSRRPPR